MAREEYLGDCAIYGIQNVAAMGSEGLQSVTLAAELMILDVCTNYRQATSNILCISRSN